jgi:hypothetical protein
MAQDKGMVCPFCGWENAGGEYEMLLVSLWTPFADTFR